jgi:Domain of unknown function (DUF4405)
MRTPTPTDVSPVARPLSWRAFFSFVVVFAFAVLAVTGIALYVTPPGRVANWSGWTLAGLTKTNWQAVHMVFGFTFLVAGAFHLFFNWKVLLNYLRSRVHTGIPRGREAALASVIGVALLALSIADVPPVSAVASVRDRVANSWSTTSTEPPIPHAELLPVDKVATLLKVPVETAVERLSSGGSPVSASMTLEEIARQRGVTPREVYDRIAAVTAKTAPAPVVGAGMGWKTVRQIAEEQRVAVDTAVARLRAAGIEASADESLREIAQRNGRHAPELAGLLLASTEGR